MKKKSLEHHAFILEPHDYDPVIDQLKPLLTNPHCGDLVKELITLCKRAKRGKAFHMFVETANDEILPGRYLHNDPGFERDSEHL